MLLSLLDKIAAAQGHTAAEYAYAKLGVDGPLPDALASWLTDAEMARLNPDERIRTVLVRVWPVWQSIDWRPAVLADLRADPGWDRWCELVARADEATEEARYRVVLPPATICAQLFSGTGGCPAATRGSSWPARIHRCRRTGCAGADSSHSTA